MKENKKSYKEPLTKHDYDLEILEEYLDEKYTFMDFPGASYICDYKGLELSIQDIVDILYRLYSLHSEIGEELE